MVYVKMAGYLTLFRILTGSLSPTVTSSTTSLNKYLIRGIFFPSGDLNYSERDKTKHNMEKQVLHKRLSVQSDRPTIG